MRICPFKAATGRQHDQRCAAAASHRVKPCLRPRRRPLPTVASATLPFGQRPSATRRGRNATRPTIPSSNPLMRTSNPSHSTILTSIAAATASPGGIDPAASGGSRSNDDGRPQLPLPTLTPAQHASHCRTASSMLVRPLLAAVITSSAGRLAIMPPPLLIWLLRVVAAAATATAVRTTDQHRRTFASSSQLPPLTWLEEAYGCLAVRLDELTNDQAAQALLAISILARTAHSTPRHGSSSDPLQLPLPEELLLDLYETLACTDEATGADQLDPRVALACLEAAASLESSHGEDMGMGLTAEMNDSSSRTGGYTGGSASMQASPKQHSRRPSRLLLPAMPQATVEALLWRAVGREPPHASSASAVAASANAFAALPLAVVAAAAARALIASAHLTNLPGTAVLTSFAELLAEGSPGGGVPPQLLVNALLALCALRAPSLSPAAFEALIRGLEAQCDGLDAVQVSYCVAAVQRLAPPDDPAAVVAFTRGPAAAALARSLRDLTAAPRLAAALAALPSPLLRPPPAEVTSAAHEALLNCLAAAADSEHLAEALRQLDAADALPTYGWQTALAAAIAQRLQDPVAADAVPSQELSNTMFVLAALNYRPSYSWIVTAAAALQPMLLTLTSAQLTNALWALAKFGYRVEAASSPFLWSVSAVQAVQLQLPSLQPHQLSYSLGSLQRLGCHVSPAVLDEMLFSAADQLPYYPPSDLVLLLMTVMRLRHVPSYSFTEAVTERLRPHLAATAATPVLEDGDGEGGGKAVAAAAAAAALGDTTGAVRGTAAAAADEPLTCQELVSVGYALAKLHSRPEAEWMSLYMAASEAQLQRCPADLLASLLWAVGELGQVPSPAWLSAFLSACRPRLSDFTPPDLVSVLSSLAALRCAPPADWLAEALTLLGARVGGLDGEGVTALLKALVDLDARVSNPQWYDALCDQVCAYLPLLPAAVLVQLVAALAALGHRPPPEWLNRCSGAVAARVLAGEEAAMGGAAGGGVMGGAAGAGIERGSQEQEEVGWQQAAGTGDNELGERMLGQVLEQGAAIGGGGGNGGGGSSSSSGSRGGLSERQLEELVCGLSQMGAELPLQLRQVFFTTTAPSLATMPPERISSMVSALAVAQVAPEPAWLDELTNAVRSNVLSYTLVQLDAVTRALAVFVSLVPEHGPTRNLLAYLREFCLYG